jgi:hypothetical protein
MVNLASEPPLPVPEAVSAEEALSFVQEAANKKRRQPNINIFLQFISFIYG